MALSDFFVERRVVADDHGRRFTIRTPKVRTLVVFMTCYAEAVKQAHEAWKELENKPNDPTPLLIERFAVDTESMALVLATCIEDLPLPDLQQLLAEEPETGAFLVKQVLALCEPKRILKTLSLDALGTPESPFAPSGFEIAIVGSAVRYGVPPETVLDWSYMSLVRSGEVLDWLSKKPSDRPTGVIAKGSDLPAGLAAMSAGE